MAFVLNDRVKQTSTSTGTATISLGPPQSNRVVAISTSGTSTIIDFPEGTGSPFGVGDAVVVARAKNFLIN